MTTEKTIMIKTSVSKVISLLYNTLSRFVRAFLPRSTCLNFMAKKIKAVTVLIVSPSICDGTGCHELSFLNVQF